MRKLEHRVYTNYIDGYIYLKPDSVPVVRQRGAFPAYTNTQVNAVFRGIDATLMYQLTKALTLTSKTSLLFAYDRTNHDYLIYISPNRTQSSLRYECPKWGKLSKLFVEMKGLYIAAQHRVPQVAQQRINEKIIFTGDFAPPPPGYFLLSTDIGFSLQTSSHTKDTMSVILSCTNINNVAYRDYLNRFRYFADEMGRNFTLKVRIPFSNDKQ